jgi:hypothetical protein
MEPTVLTARDPAAWLILLVVLALLVRARVPKSPVDGIDR